jgi:hypothetical protein
MSIELKIKSKHLSLEAKVIKFEEAKLKRQMRWHREHDTLSDSLVWKFNSIVNHRKHDVKNENRATFLARAFIKGVPYSKVENKRRLDNEPTFKRVIMPRVLALVNRYHNRNVTRTALDEWTRQ